MRLNSEIVLSRQRPGPESGPLKKNYRDRDYWKKITGTGTGTTGKKLPGPRPGLELYQIHQDYDRDHWKKKLPGPNRDRDWKNLVPHMSSHYTTST